MASVAEKSLQAIKNLEPSLVWKRFYEMSQIPRPSKKEDQVIQWLKKFSDDRKFTFRKDHVGNTVIEVPATKGFENVPSIAIQGHVDMVCEKNKEKVHDFDKDPIELMRDGDWIKANGTTLGSDNGIGCCCGLAIADDTTSVHGPLELLFTIDEEMGMTGAMNLKSDFLKSKILLNIDSEERDSFYIGCAGGQDCIAKYHVEWENVPQTHVAYELMVAGLNGGHSGVEIHTGRANSIKLLGRLLHMLNNSDVKFNISSINAGSKLNAIPREAEVLIYVDPKDEANVNSIIDKFLMESLNEYKGVEDGLKVLFNKLNKETSPEQKSFSSEFLKKITSVLLAMPQGVIQMSPSIPDLVETSTNLATIFTLGDDLEIGTSQRSSIDHSRYFLGKSVVSIFEMSGAYNVKESDPYTGWSPNVNSNILELSKQVFKKLFNKEPEVKAIHAGLECGILGGIFDGMDMVSFGPTIRGAHSPDEKILIEDVPYTYDLLKAILSKHAEQHKQ